MIGIIADLHDHLVNFEQFLKKTCDDQLAELWIAGDLGTPETLAEVSAQFTGRIRAVAGNVETGHDLTSYEKISHHYRQLVFSSKEPLLFSLNNRSMAMFHFPRSAFAYVKTTAPDLVISGHSHRPNLQKIEATWHLNPGTLAGIFTPATYVLANLETMEFTLHRLYEGTKYQAPGTK